MKIKFNYPELYIFRVTSNNSEIQNKYKNIYIKIGDTHRGVDVRINEWQDLLRKFNNDNTLKVNLIKSFSLVKDITKEISETNPVLRDYFIHKELVNKFHYIRLSKNIYGSDEFFEIVNYISDEHIINCIQNLINDIFDNIDSYNIHFGHVTYINQIDAFDRVKSFKPRFYQNEMQEIGYKVLIEQDLDRFLNWCSPRTGKTYSCCWLNNKLANAYNHPLFNLVITGMPSVRDEWRKTIQEHQDFKNIIFACRAENNTYIYWNTEESNKQITVKNIKDLYNIGQKLNKHIMLFLSLQDITGKQITEENLEHEIDIDINVKDRYKIFFEEKIIDFIIIDEAHYAALNPENKTGKFLEDINKIQHYKRIDNSATPYKAAFNGIYDETNSYYFNIDEFLIKDKNELNEEQYNYQCLLKDEFPQLFTVCPLNSDFFEKNIKKLENKKLNYKKRYIAAYQIIEKIFADFNSGLDLLHNKTIIENFLCKNIIMSCSEIEHAQIVMLALSNYLKTNKINDYKICQIVGEKIESDNIEYFDDVNKYKEFIKEQYKNRIKTITVTCQKWLTGNTFPELDTFIILRNISSAESYDQWTKRIYNPFHTEYGSKQNVLIWNWNKNMLFNLAAYKAGLLKEGTNISNNNYKDVNDNVINELLKLNIIIPNKKNIKKSGEYIYVHDKNMKETINELTMFLPDEVKNILSITKIKSIETFIALNTIAEFLSNKFKIKINNGNFELCKYKEGEKINNSNNSNEKDNNNLNKTNSNKTTNNNSEIIKSLNNHKYFTIDFLRYIKLFTIKYYNKNIESCGDLITVWNNILTNDDAIMEAFYYGNDIINIIENMKFNEPINYNILSENIKNLEYDEKYFVMFDNKYLKY